MKIKNALIVYYIQNYGVLDRVEHALHIGNVTYLSVNRQKLNSRIFKNKDIIITVGGDGTFLHAAKFSKDTPILGVCSDLKINEGFFTKACGIDFAKKLTFLLKGKYKITNLMRLEATINKTQKLPLALNEVFIGSKQPYHTSRYTLHISRKKEFQKSSGVIVATPAGSYAWAKSAGGKILPINSKKYQYIVREPYFGRLTKPQLLKGILNPKQTIKIRSHIHEGIAVVDSQPDEYMFCDNDIIEIKVSKKPLRMVKF
jgi:NAD+ kinase